MKLATTLAICLLLIAPVAADAQAVGGNASLSVSTSTSSVPLPASMTTYPAILVSPSPGSSAEVFYSFGGSSVTATTNSLAMPPGGICYNNVGASNNYLAAITATGSATLRITQLAYCPPSWSGSSGSSGTFSGSVTIGASTTGGFSKAFYPALAGTIQYPKTTAGQVVRVQCDNIAGGSAAYVQLFDAASGATLGTSVIDFIPLAAGGTGGFTLSGAGVQYSSGIALGAATTANGSTPVTTSVNCAVSFK